MNERTNTDKNEQTNEHGQTRTKTNKRMNTDKNKNRPSLVATTGDALIVSTTTLCQQLLISCLRLLELERA